MWCRLVILIYLLPDIGRIIECIDDLIEEITVIQNFLMTVISCHMVNDTWQKRLVVDDFQTPFIYYTYIFVMFCIGSMYDMTEKYLRLFHSSQLTCLYEPLGCLHVRKNTFANSKFHGSTDYIRPGIHQKLYMVFVSLNERYQVLKIRSFILFLQFIVCLPHAVI